MKTTYALALMIAAHSCMSGNAMKGDQVVKAEEINARIEKGLDVFYENKTIEGNIDFTLLSRKFAESPVMTRAGITGSFTLINCVINGNITGFSRSGDKITASDFGKNFSLIDCKVEGETNIREAMFNGNVNCSKTAFKKQATFEGSRFSANANFSNCIFMDEARFHNCLFNWKTNFLDAQFARVSGFQGASFNGDAQFGNMRCTGYADFTVLNFNAGAYFNYVNFDGRSSFGGTVFKDRSDFNNTSFIDDASFKDARFQGAARFNNISVSKALAFESALFFSGKPEISFAGADMKQRVSFEKARVGDLYDFGGHE